MEFNMATKTILPATCYVKTEEKGAVMIKYGIKGYFPTNYHVNDVDELNERKGVTKEQADIMKSASMFGWNIPLVSDYYKKQIEKRDAIEFSL